MIHHWKARDPRFRLIYGSRGRASATRPAESVPRAQSIVRTNIFGHAAAKMTACMPKSEWLIEFRQITACRIHTCISFQPLRLRHACTDWSKSFRICTQLVIDRKCWFSRLTARAVPILLDEGLTHDPSTHTSFESRGHELFNGVWYSFSRLHSEKCRLRAEGGD